MFTHKKVVEKKEDLLLLNRHAVYFTNCVENLNIWKYNAIFIMKLKIPKSILINALLIDACIHAWRIIQ
jgi:hypothetical protein